MGAAPRGGMRVMRAADIRSCHFGTFSLGYGRIAVTER
jgi:hypothetical protein